MTINGGIFLIQQVYNKRLSGSWPFIVKNITSIVNSLSAVNEGSSVSISVNTTDFQNETLYWTIQQVSGTINSSDFSSLSGSFVVQANNYGFFTVTTTSDTTTEGEESFNVQVRSGSTSGPILITSGTITINDTSLSVPTYSVTPAAGSVNEGSSLNFNVTTTNVSDGTTLYWTLTNSGDFSTSFGSFIINSNAGSFSVTPTADLTTEGSETFTASIRTVSTSGDIVATSSSVTINDTSITPAPQEYSWIAGNSSNTTTVERYELANDTNTTSYRGNMDYGLRLAKSFGLTNSGWFGGGYLFPGTYYSNISRITYSTDTATASTRGKISYPIGIHASTNNSDYGWFGGGGNAPGLTVRSSVSRFTFASDSSNATTRGPLVVARSNLTGFGNSLFGWFMAGGPSTANSRVDRVTYSTDTAAASARTPLTFGGSGTASGNDTYIWHFASSLSPGPGAAQSRIQRITMSSDTVALTLRGNLRSAVPGGSVYSTENSTNSWIFNVTGSSIDRYTHATDTETTSLRSTTFLVRGGAADATPSGQIS